MASYTKSRLVNSELYSSGIGHINDPFTPKVLDWVGIRPAWRLEAARDASQSTSAVNGAGTTIRMQHIPRVAGTVE